MKDKWSDNIKGKLANYEIDPPKGLWENVNANLPYKVRERKYVWWPWLVLGTFAMMIILSVFLWQTDPKENYFSTDRESIAVVIAPKKDDWNLTCNLDSPLQLYNLRSKVSTNSIGLGKSVNSGEVSRLNETKGRAQENIEKIYDTEEDTEEVRFEDYPRIKIKTRQYGFEVYSSVAGGYSKSSVSRSGFSSGLGMENASWRDDPALGVALFNYGSTQKIEMKHDIPMKIGLAFSYELNDKLSLSAGISNVLLRSEYKEGTQHHYRSGEQNIRYIGVPIDVKYDLLTRKSFNIYSSAGVSFDKCYKATRTNDYIIGDENRLKEIDNLSERPFQFSASLNFGVEYCFYNGVWAFVQGGIGYYFKDGSSLNTIYKYRPTSFSLGAGLRIDMSFTR